MAPSVSRAKGACGDAAKGEDMEMSKGGVRKNVSLGNRKISKEFSKRQWRKGKRGFESAPPEIKWCCQSLWS